MPADLGCYESEYNAFGVFGRRDSKHMNCNNCDVDVWYTVRYGYTVWYGMV